MNECDCTCFHSIWSAEQESIIKGPYTNNSWLEMIPRRYSFSQQHDEDLAMNPEFNDGKMLQQNGKLKLTENDE